VDEFQRRPLIETPKLFLGTLRLKRYILACFPVDLHCRLSSSSMRAENLCNKLKGIKPGSTRLISVFMKKRGHLLGLQNNQTHITTVSF